MWGLSKYAPLRMLTPPIRQVYSITYSNSPSEVPILEYWYLQNLERGNNLKERFIFFIHISFCSFHEGARLWCSMKLPGSTYSVNDIITAALVQSLKSLATVTLKRAKSNPLNHNQLPPAYPFIQSRWKSRLNGLCILLWKSQRVAHTVKIELNNEEDSIHGTEDFLSDFLECLSKVTLKMEGVSRTSLTT